MSSLSPTLVVVALVAITVGLTVVGLGVGWWLLRARLAALDEKLAWAQIESAPEAALKAFRRLLKRLPKSGRRKHSPAEGRASFGAALCLARLRRFEEAAEFEQRARDNATLTPEDEARLCAAFLAVEPQPLPDAAADAYARYLTLPLTHRNAETERRARAALEAALATDGDALRVGRRALKLLPDQDWLLYAVGLAYAAAGRPRDALDPLQKAVAADPARPERHQALGRAHLALGEPAPGRAALIEAHRLAPDAESAYQAALVCLDCPHVPFTAAERQAAGDRAPPDFALALMGGACQQSPADARYWTALGRTQALLGRHAEAVPSFECALALAPNTPVTLCHLAQSQLALGQHAKAHQTANRALELDGNLADALRVSGDLACAAGDYAQALRHYQRLNATAPTADLAERLALSYLGTGQPDQVVRLLQGRPSYDPVTRLVLARAQAQLKRWPEALATLQGLDPARATPEYRYYLANALGANGHHAAAISMFEGLLADPTWGPLARRGLGHGKLLSGDLVGADQCYSAGQAAGEPDADFDLGRVSLLRNDATWATTHFTRAAADPEAGKAVRLGLALAQSRGGDLEPLAALVEDEDLGPWASEPLADAAYKERRYVEALPAYERALRKRTKVSSQILCRLAVGYLQLNRHREALPHLVELSRRHPRAAPIRYNLAVCRYHLGRGHYRQGRWDLARGEWSRCCHLLRPLAAAEADAVHQWELEATYRAASALLQTERPGEVDRALQLFRGGAQASPNEPRWRLGVGLASALAGQHEPAAAAFAEARRLAPDRVAPALGEGLSLLAAEQGDRARAVLAEVAQRTRNEGQAPTNALYNLAARLAVVVAHARERQWARAAGELQQLMTHSLIRSSASVSPDDVAQVTVAYYALGGEKEKASEVARRHLRGGQALGDTLIGLVQAEAGDYAGAAETLGRAYEQERNPTVCGILVACLLAAAAERVLSQDLKAAAPFVKKALGYDANHAEARRLSEALAFGREFQKLNLAQIDKAIEQCEKLLEGDEPAGQLVRTLGVLHHRKALALEQKNRGEEELWLGCVKYWKKWLLGSDPFWERYAQEYNAGKGRREQVKPEDVTAWREELPACFANAHAGYAGAALKRDDASSVPLHLELIWKWKPDFEPPKDFLLADIGQMDQSKAELLEQLRKKVKNKEVSATLGRVAAGYWNGRAGEKTTEAAQHHATSVNRANLAIQLVNAAMGGASGNPRAAAPLLLQAKEMLRDARGDSESACRHMDFARKYIDKAYELAPDEPAIKENHKGVREVAAKVRENHNAICKNYDELTAGLSRIGLY